MEGKGLEGTKRSSTLNLRSMHGVDNDDKQICAGNKISFKLDRDRWKARPEGTRRLNRSKL